MNKKIINIITAIAIYFAIAAIIEFVVGWGIDNKWTFVAIWSVCMALIDVLIFQKLRQKAAANKKKRQEA